MTVERHEITYSFTFTDQLIRDDIEYTAALEPFENLGSLMQAKVLACREWLEANPQGLTREEFDKLPDGTVVALDDSIEYIKVGNRLGFTNHFDRVAWLCLDAQSLPDMTVVSTPAPPSLDKVDVVLDLDDVAWEKLDSGRWAMIGADSNQRTTYELIDQYGPLTPLIPGPQIGGSE